MSKSEVEVYTPGSLKGVDRKGDQTDRFRAYSHALEAVDDPRCPRPIPRFMLDMPWAENDEEVQERIIAMMLASDDPYQTAQDPTTTASKALIGRPMTVWDMRCRPSDKPGGWGAYLVCDITVGDSELHQVLTCGSKQAVATLAYAWASGDLPIAGTFRVITETGKGNQVIGFIREDPF
jgi:hypothetical protein